MACPRSPEGGCESQGDSRLPEVPRHLMASRPVSPPFAGQPGLCSMVKPRALQAHGLEHFSTRTEMKRLAADPSLHGERSRFQSSVPHYCITLPSFSWALGHSLPSSGGAGVVCVCQLVLCPPPHRVSSRDDTGILRPSYSGHFPCTYRCSVAVGEMAQSAPPC